MRVILFGIFAVGLILLLWFGGFDRKGHKPSSWDNLDADLDLEEEAPNNWEGGGKREMLPSRALLAENAVDAGHSARSVNGIPYQLTVEVRTSMSRDAKPVPELEVEIGVGYVNRTGLHVPILNENALATGRADEVGNLQLEVLVPVDFQENPVLGKPIFWGKVISSGYQQWLHRQPNFDREDRTVRIQVAARKGGTIRGRVRKTPNGLTQGGEVRLLRKRVDKDGYRSVSNFRTNTEGAFVLHYPDPGTYHLYARFSHQGVGSIRDLHLELADPPQDLEIYLQGEGVLAGQVLDLQDQPMAYYDVWALPAARKDHAVGYFHRPERIKNEWSGGLYDDVVKTDREGRFRFEGLQEGFYVMRGTRGGTGYRELLLTPVPIASGREDVIIKAERFRLVVQVWDHEGNRIHPLLNHDPESWHPKKLTAGQYALMCRESQADGELVGSRFPGSMNRTLTPEGDAIYGVEPGKYYLLEFRSTEYARIAEVIQIPLADYRTVHEIHLPIPVAAGSLKVHMEAPNGEPFEDWNQFRILSLKDGQVIAQSRRLHKDSTFATPLAAGSYLVEVADKPLRGHHGERFDFAAYLPSQEIAQVFPNRETQITIRLREGAAIVLLVEVEGQKDLQRWPQVPEEARLLKDLRVSHEGAVVRLFHASDKKAENLQFHGPGERLQQFSFYNRDVDWVVPGNSTKSIHRIPAGEYVLEVHKEGFPSAAQKVRLAAGEQRTVTVKLRQ